MFLDINVCEFVFLRYFALFVISGLSKSKNCQSGSLASWSTIFVSGSIRLVPCLLDKSGDPEHIGITRILPCLYAHNLVFYNNELKFEPLFMLVCLFKFGRLLTN